MTMIGMVDGRWSVVERRRKQFVDRQWNNKGVTTMFVSNIPDGVSKETIRKIFSNKYGELTDVYMATKKDSIRKNFAFVRYRNVNGDRELEASLQKIMCSGGNWEDSSSSTSTTTPFKKKPVVLTNGAIMAEWLHNPLTLVGEAHSLEKLKKILLFLRLGGEQTYGMKYLGGLMVGIRFRSPSDVKEFLSKKDSWNDWFKEFKHGNTINGVFDRIAWLKIVELQISLWNEENFSRIGGEFGKVLEPIDISPSSQDLSLRNICILTDRKLRINEEIPVVINRNIFNVGVMERDFDWSPFPSGPYDIIIDSESFHKGDTDESTSTGKNVDDGLLEEGEIQEGITGEAAIPVTIDPGPNSERIEVEGPIEDQQPIHGGQILPPRDFESRIDLGTGNNEFNSDEESNRPGMEKHLSPNNIVPDLYSPVDNLVAMGCFGPFSSGKNKIDKGPMFPSNTQVTMAGYESGNTMDKRRRIIRTPFPKSPKNQLRIDINCPNTIPPEQIPLPDSPVVLSPTDEAKKTVEIGQILGFEIENVDPILTEAMGEIGENQVPR
ncbi:unnamed protein product [Lactuca saligna]|uniref:RRM domain-containing protein n=1 Tax=Lactuca saligna TaxID=75948 RepID=A0AA35YUS1_LACSI|nr:unnamed protein product [Lactuca saligna]